MKLKKWLITTGTIGSIVAPVAAVVSCTSSKGTITFDNGMGEAYGNTEWLFKVSFDKQALALKLEKFKGDKNKAIQELIKEMQLKLVNRLPDAVKNGEFSSSAPYILNDGFTISFYYPVKSILNSKLMKKDDLYKNLSEFLSNSLKHDGTKKFVYKTSDFNKYFNSTIISLITKKLGTSGKDFINKYFVTYSNKEHKLANGDYVQFDYKGYLKSDLSKYKNLEGKLVIPHFVSFYSKTKAKELVKDDVMASHLYKYTTKAKWDAAVDKVYTDSQLEELVNSQPYLTSLHLTSFIDRFPASDKDKKAVTSWVDKTIKELKTKYENEGLLGLENSEVEKLPQDTQDKLKAYKEDKERYQSDFWKYFGNQLDELEKKIIKEIDDIKTNGELNKLIDKLLKQYDFLERDETVYVKSVLSPTLNVHDYKLLKDLVKDDAAAKKLKHYKSKEYWDETVDALTTLASANELLSKEPSLKLPKEEELTSIYGDFELNKDDKEALKKLIKDDEEAKEHNLKTKEAYEKLVDSFKTVAQVWTLEDKYGVKLEKITSLKDISYLDTKLNEHDVEAIKKIIPSSTLTTKSTIKDLLDLEKANKNKFEKQYSSEQSVKLLDDTDKQKAKDLAKDDKAVQKIKGFETKTKDDFDEAIDSIKTVDGLRTFLFVHELKEWTTYHSPEAKDPLKFTDEMKKTFKDFVVKEITKEVHGEKTELLDEYKTDEFKTLKDYIDAIEKLVTYDQYTEFFNNNIKVVKLNDNDRKHAKELIKDDETAKNRLKNITTKVKWNDIVDKLLTLKDLKSLFKNEHKEGTDELKLNSYTSKKLVASTDVVKKPEDKDNPERIAPSELGLTDKDGEFQKALNALNMKDGEIRLIDIQKFDPSYTKLGYFFWSGMRGNTDIYEDLMSKGTYDHIAYIQVKKENGTYQYRLVRKTTAFKGGEAKNHIFQMGLTSFIDGFDTMMKGMVAETKDDQNQRSITPTFDEYYGTESLAGEQVIFDITVHKIAHTKDLDSTDFIKEVVKKNKNLEKALKDYNFDKIKDLASLKDSLSKQNQDATKGSWYSAWLKDISKDLEFEFPRAVTYNIANNLFMQMLRKYPQMYWQYLLKQRQSITDGMVKTTYVHGKKTNGRALVIAAQIEAARRYALELGFKKTDKKDIQAVFKDKMKEKITIKPTND